MHQRRFLGWPGGVPPVKTLAPCGPPYWNWLQGSCIQSVALHSWCQITPFTQSCIMSSEILGPPRWRCGHPTGHPKLLQLESPLSITLWYCVKTAKHTVKNFCRLIAPSLCFLWPILFTIYLKYKTGMKLPRFSAYKSLISETSTSTMAGQLFQIRNVFYRITW